MLELFSFWRLTVIITSVASNEGYLYGLTIESTVVTISSDPNCIYTFFH